MILFLISGCECIRFFKNLNYFVNRQMPFF